MANGGQWSVLGSTAAANTGGNMCVEARAARLPMPVGRAPRLENCESVISGELGAACELPDLTTDFSSQRRKVLSWLRLHHNLIVRAESYWQVDRRAIAGVIAWEALNNVKSLGGWGSRFRGPGKVHKSDFFWKPPAVAIEVEKAGYLGVVSEDLRAGLLGTSAGSIRYIAAIMRAMADVVTKYGKYPPEDVHWSPAILATWYHGQTLLSLKNRYSTLHYPDHRLQPGDMGVWVNANLTFLEEAVGQLPDSCRPPIRPMPHARISD